MSKLTDAVDRLDAYMHRTTVLPPPELAQANFDMGLIVGLMTKVLAERCFPEHDHHVMPHKNCPLR